MKTYYKKGQKLLIQVEKTKVPEGTLAIWNIGQAGLLIKTSAGRLVAIDPYLTSSIEENNPETEFVRVFPPILEPEDLKEVDAVFVTHHHDDHLDTQTIERLAKVSSNTIFYIPAPHVAYARKQCPSLTNVQPTVAGEKMMVKEIEVTAIASAHADYEQDVSGNHLFLGYILKCDGITLYHSGDTLLTDDLYEAMVSVRPDIACLPINGGDYFRFKRNIIPNMTSREAADFGVAMQADLIMPIHYDMFPNNRENPSYFVDYLLQNYPGQKFHMSAPGERFFYFK